MNNIELQKEIAVLQTTVQGLKQERDELAAMVAVKDDALQRIDDTSEECEGDDGELVFSVAADAIHEGREALSITGPAALHEVRARVLEEAAENAPDDASEKYCRSMAAAERAKGEK